MERTKYCGAFREPDVGTAATAMGWVDTRRDMGGVVFLDLRDREGTLQVVCDRSAMDADSFARAERLRAETVVAVRGVIRLRGKDTVNPAIASGTVELAAASLEVLSEAAPLPFSLRDAADVREEVRLRDRCLDLRRPELLANLRLRHRVETAVRQYLDADGFLSVETPILTKSTPEGARDYLVPSRVHPGSFYALPQSPQQFKQMLMAGGIDKYYQIARCFRDEDLRADRQPEFTQVDMELSFVGQEDVLEHLERLFGSIFREIEGVDLPPMPRLTWQTAMDVYGSDKPDLRIDLPIVELTDLAASCSFEVFRRVTEAGGVVRGINVPGGDALTHTQIEALTAGANRLGAKGMAWVARRADGEPRSILTKFFAPEELSAIFERAGVRPGDLLLFCADKLPCVRRVLGGLRLALADLLSLRRPGHALLFVTDFPQFEYSAEERRWVATHHPFTMPYPEDLPYLESDPGRVRAQAYDVVLDGVELGSGSVRIHDSALQRRMFRALGIPEDQIEARFGFLLRAFRYGTPPHAGFAFGLDRLVMLLAGAASLRDVIAFPKARDGSCPLTNAPDEVDPAQLEALGISLGGAPRVKTEKTVQIDLDKVARLAKLTLRDDEREPMRRDLAAIVGFADRLAGLDAEGVPPTTHVLPTDPTPRADEVAPSLPHGALLAAAPLAREGCFVVPRTVE